MPTTASPRRSSRSTCARTASCAEKNDLNSLLFLLTPGVESQQGRHADLSRLVAFKKLHDDNALLEEVIPEFVAGAGRRATPACGCATSAREMHALLPRGRMSARCRPRSSAPSTCPRSPCRRTRRCAAWCATMSTTCRSTRSTAASRPRLCVVYPPGIATIVPGERLTERAQPMIDYLKMFETRFNAFPGFDIEIQGVYREVDANGRIRLHTYVVAE